MRTVSAIILVSLAAGGIFAGGFSWKVAFAIAAIGQCFVAYLETGRLTLIKNAVFVLLVTAAPTLLVPSLPEVIQARISTTTADWVSCIVSFLAFVVATVVSERPAPEKSKAAALPCGQAHRSTRVISARITSG